MWRIAAVATLILAFVFALPELAEPLTLTADESFWFALSLLPLLAAWLLRHRLLA